MFREKQHKDYLLLLYNQNEPRQTRIYAGLPTNQISGRFGKGEGIPAINQVEKETQLERRLVVEIQAPPCGRGEITGVT